MRNHERHQFVIISLTQMKHKVDEPKRSVTAYTLTQASQKNKKTKKQKIMSNKVNRSFKQETMNRFQQRVELCEHHKLISINNSLKYFKTYTNIHDDNSQY